MIKLEINLYDFDELSDNAKRKAINEHRQFLIETEQPSDYYTFGEYEEQMAYIATNDEYIIENIKCNDYLFYADGNLCWSCQYVAGPKKGITEINIHGELFTLGGGANK